MASYARSSGNGHVGDVIVTNQAGIAHRIMAETGDYFLVLSCMSKSGDWQAVRKSSVGARDATGSVFRVFECSHGVPTWEPLPEAAGE